MFFDLAQVSLFGAAGATILIKARRDCQRGAANFVLLRASSAAMRVLKFTDLVKPVAAIRVAWSPFLFGRQTRFTVPGAVGARFIRTSNAKGAGGRADPEPAMAHLWLLPRAKIMTRRARSGLSGGRPGAMPSKQPYPPWRALGR